MATRVKRKPQAIDHKKSRRWGLAGLGSVGAGIGPVGVGMQLFDLINLSTGRAHSFHLVNGGVGYNFEMPISGSFGSSDYEEFTTPRDVNFFDFDGTFMTVRETNALVYSWTHVSFWGMTVTIAGGGLNIPGLGVSSGIARFIFSDGRPMGGDFELKPELDLRTREPHRDNGRVHAQEDSPSVRIPGDMLFGFDEYRLKATQQTHQLLWEVMQAMEKSWSPDHRWLIQGHTDSIGSKGYNKALGKRRADSVANWITLYMPGWKNYIKTEGVGETDPVASNATPEGRAKNRRVEVYTMPMKYWKDY
jgi:outer membrane protein OmpA-like peptidoglycan-associated protein